MPIVASQDLPTIVGIAPSGTTPQPTKGETTVDPMASTFRFIVGWILLITILTFVNTTRLGHVIIYYALLLMILFILVTEYAQIVPYLNAIQTIGQFNSKKNAS